MSDDTSKIHELLKPFKYVPKNSGEEVEAQFITMNEPSVRNLTHCSVLKQCFMRVLAAESSSNDSESDSPSTTEVEIAMESRIMNALYASDVDIVTVLLSAKELFKDVCLVDGEKKLTAPMLDAMSIEDIESMAGKYMANFILASVLKDE